MKTIKEVRLTPEQQARLVYGTWTHEATRKADGARLYTKSSYRHTVKGEWESILVYADGRIEHQWQMPRIRRNSKQWDLTAYGMDVRQEGRA